MDPVFQPVGCEVEPVEPIAAIPGISICQVEPTPDPIFDCPAPLPVLTGSIGPPGPCPQILFQGQVVFTTSASNLEVRVRKDLVDCTHRVLLTLSIFNGGAGPVGAQGATGPQGPDGPQGARGFRGFRGQRGGQGITGPIGLTGFRGEMGRRGGCQVIGGATFSYDDEVMLSEVGFYQEGCQVQLVVPDFNESEQAVGPQGDDESDDECDIIGPTGPQGPQGLPADCSYYEQHDIVFEEATSGCCMFKWCPQFDNWVQSGAGEACSPPEEDGEEGQVVFICP